LEGTASDTATVVSANFNNTVKLENFAVKDTTGGIYFSWKAQEPNPLYVGLAVERKTMREKDYHGIDTIPFTADSYLDARVIPNISYAYQFRPVNLRFTPLMPSANATALHRGGKVNTLIPTAISARPGKNGIEVKWRMVRHYNVNGYYVYRSINNSAYEQYSGLLNDTLFVDTSATNGRTLYTYKIATIDFADVIGGLSNPVQAKPANTILPQDVSGVLTTSEAGKIALRWNDMTRFDNYVRGYNVYRKAEREVITGVKTVDELKRSGFTKLNTQLVIPPVYSDNTAQGGTYTYAVTTVDIDGNESNISQLAEARPIEKRIAAPSYFSLLKTTAGVELRWDDELQKEVTDYAIYRRTREAENTTLLGKVKATQLKYTDATAVAGTFYFYSVKAQSATGESDFSTEKGIVK
nr:hypothetical protein [Chitinophagales bacterium]